MREGSGFWGKRAVRGVDNQTGNVCKTNQATGPPGDIIRQRMYQGCVKYSPKMTQAMKFPSVAVENGKIMFLIEIDGRRQEFRVKNPLLGGSTCTAVIKFTYWLVH